MPKYSVKKPFTILVAVILVLVLGFVSLTGIQTDLLPAMNLPYLMVVTTYPGASPEQVEANVTKPLEDSLSTLNGVKNVTSQSSENYSLVILEYQDDTNMDSALVKASTAVNQIEGSLPELAATPMLIEMSPDMMATQYVAVDSQGMDVYELSALVEDTILPRLERLDGVASVSTIGLVEQTVEALIEGSVEFRVQRSFIQGAEVLKGAPKITKEMCRIDWNKPSVQVCNFVRGMSPYPTAWTEISKEGESPLTMKVFFAERLSTEDYERLSSGRTVVPGQILSDGKSILAVATADGAVALTDLQMAGKKRMDAKSFLLGFREPENYTVK